MENHSVHLLISIPSRGDIRIDAPNSLEELIKIVSDYNKIDPRLINVMYDSEGSLFRIVNDWIYLSLIESTKNQNLDELNLLIEYSYTQNKVQSVFNYDNAEELRSISPSDSPSQLDNQRSVIEKPLGKRTEMVYQPFKLLKKMCDRHIDGRDFRGLEEIKGLEWIRPDTEFKQSIFKDLLYDKNIGRSKVEFLIVVTMFDEKVKSLKDTMLGIANNLNEFKNAGVPTKEICCIIIVDGMKQFIETYNKQQRFFSNWFDKDKITEFFNVDDCLKCEIPNESGEEESVHSEIPNESGEQEFAHCFMQNATFNNLDDDLQLIFCVKQHNRRKLNTHLWFFGGFCEMLNPNYVMLLDVGTKPLPRSLFLLYEAMKTDKRIAGCCGEIRPMETSFWNFVVSAQMVEYKFAHIFDKSLESLVGYITVLPGAFSAYRWSALRGEILKDHYFKSICHPELMDAFQSNIFLAEDRVLCLALISKKDCDYLLRYVKDAYAETDVPDTLSSLMGQRRRWINGSWFALIDTLRRAKIVFQSSHSCFRKCCFATQMAYYMVNVVSSWFMVGSMFLAFAIAIRSGFGDDDNNVAFNLSSLIIVSYVTLLMITFIMALGVKPKQAEDAYKFIAGIFGLYMLLTAGLMIKFISENLNSTDWIIPLMIATIIIFTLNTLCHCAAFTILKGVLHFIILSPSYVNILLIYAICNIHDCTWGNRPDQQTDDEKATVESFEKFRTRWAVIWVLSNTAFGYYLNIIDRSDSEVTRWLIHAIAFMWIGILMIRCIGGLIYLCQEYFKKKLIVKSNEAHNEEQSNSLHSIEDYKEMKSVEYERIEKVCEVNSEG